MDYNLGIHFKSGKTYSVNHDIIITPFWTEEYCDFLIEISEKYTNNFSKNIKYLDSINNRLGWDDLKLDFIDELFYKPYVSHYKKDILPILKQVYTDTIGEISGWFYPYIIRYSEKNQMTNLHHDASTVTLNIKLNNDYEGCDLYFPRQNFSCQDIPIGHAIVWPSTVTHPHGSTRLISGKKYSFVSWSWPPQWTREGISA